MADQAVGGLPQAAEGTSNYGNKFFFVNALVTTASISIQQSVEQSVTMTGLLAGDMLVSTNKADGITLGLGVVQGRVSAANTLRLTLNNSASLAQVAGSATNYSFLIFRPAI